MNRFNLLSGKPPVTMNPAVPITILLFLICLITGTGRCQSTALQPVDAFDTFDSRGHSDRILLLGPGAQQTVLLQMCNPDSVVFVSFVGSFPADLISVESITPFPAAWNGANGTLSINNAAIDNGIGTFEALSGILDSRGGLTNNENRNVFTMQITPGNLLSPENPVITGTIALNTISSKIMKPDNIEITDWVSHELTLKLAYVGDIAGATLDVTGEVPYLEPQPDGVVDFHDMVAFVDGWNGNGIYRDKIADINVLPNCTAPDLIPNRDNEWDQDDIDALLTNWTWFDLERINSNLASEDQWQNPFSGYPETSRTTIVSSGANPQTGTAVEVESNLGVPMPGEKFDVIVRVREADQLMAASIGLTYDPAQLKLLIVEAGEMLKREADVIAHTFQDEGEVEYSIGRLSTTAPGVSGDGFLMVFTFQVILPPDNGLRVAYDLRDQRRFELAEGTFNIGVYGSSPVTALALTQNFPNPVRTSTNLVFSLPYRCRVDLAVYDLSGRRVVTLMNEVKETDVYTVDWNRTDQYGHLVPAGAYFYRLQTDSGNLVRRLMVVK